MYRTTTERLTSLLINSISLAVSRGGLTLKAEGLLKGDDLLTPQGEVFFRWDNWSPEVLAAASELLTKLEIHVSSCLSGEIRSVPPPGMTIPPALPKEGEEFQDDEEDIAGSFHLAPGEEPNQF